MAASSWQLDGSTARLHCGRAQILVDLDRPAAGLHDIRWTAEQFERAALLGVVLPSDAPLGAPARLESYVRDDDLVATYSASKSCPLQVQVYWRSVKAEGALSGAVIVDLQVSVQTHLLDARPHVKTCSMWPQVDVLQMTDFEHSRWQPLDARTISKGSARSIHRPHCLIARPPGKAWSYVEMTHPADVAQSSLEHSGAVLTLKHVLFGDELEKGVILRGRVRGVFTDRARDTAVAVAAYADLLAAPLPLTA